ALRCPVLHPVGVLGGLGVRGGRGVGDAAGAVDQVVAGDHQVVPLERPDRVPGAPVEGVADDPHPGGPHVVHGAVGADPARPRGGVVGAARTEVAVLHGDVA